MHDYSADRDISIYRYLDLNAVTTTVRLGALISISGTSSTVYAGLAQTKLRRPHSLSLKEHVTQEEKAVTLSMKPTSLVSYGGFIKTHNFSDVIYQQP